MYLKKLQLENVGPIANAEINFAFRGGKPLPTVLLGPNGSGKSIALAQVANAMVVMQQALFENSDVQNGRVYKLRSPKYIRAGSSYYWSTVIFDNDAQFTEWQLSNKRKTFDESLSSDERARISLLHGWSDIQSENSSSIKNNFIEMKSSLQIAWNTQAMLFFPADRHELPAWLNEDDLSYRPKYETKRQLEGRTNRRVIRDIALKDVMDWMLDVILDSRMRPSFLTNNPPGVSSTMRVFVGYENPIEQILLRLLALVVRSDLNKAHLDVGNRHSRTVSRAFYNNQGVAITTNTLLSLSSGESQLFTLFATILMDFDKSNTRYRTLPEVHGIVLIDEADMHLHLDMQAIILPGLIKAFPNVQFLITTHSPLLVLGLEQELGKDGVQLLLMPTATEISAENFSEFEVAFDMFSNTQRYRDVIQGISNSPARPILLTEGFTDAKIISTAWDKLHGVPCPFDIVPAGIDPDSKRRIGGAEQLRRMIEFLTAVSDRRIVAMFDHDREGWERFKGVQPTAFDPYKDGISQRKHRTKNAWVMLLPTPSHRVTYTTGKAPHFYLSIEHYFSDEILNNAHIRGDAYHPMLPDIFELVDGKKAIFSDGVSALAPEEFKHFHVLFNQLKTLGLGLIT